MGLDRRLSRSLRVRVNCDPSQKKQSAEERRHITLCHFSPLLLVFALVLLVGIITYTSKKGGVMRRKRDLHILARVGIAIVGLIALGSCLAFAQGSTGAISGVVRDATGAVIPGVTVTARHIESGLTRTAVSSETGGYNLQLLPVGAYEITTEL